ncbi:MAG: hypothetical protein ACO1NO_01105 [Burkholderiaceae bacterium]
MRKMLPILLWYVALSVAAALCLALVAYPYLPSTAVGWFVFFALALPVTLAGEALGHLFFNNRPAHALQSHTNRQSFSVLRVVYLLIAMLVIFGVAWWASVKLGLEPYMSQHPNISFPANACKLRLQVPSRPCRSAAPELNRQTLPQLKEAHART